MACLNLLITQKRDNAKNTRRDEILREYRWLVDNPKNVKDGLLLWSKTRFSIKTGILNVKVCTQ